MNQTQLKYARERATAIFSARKAALKEKYTTPAVTLTLEEKVKLLRAHRGFTVQEPANGRYRNLDSLIKFTEERESVFDQKGHDIAQAELKDSYTKLMDELVLGDHEEALKLLRSFENA